jgi:hypothetical protein
MVMTGGWFKFMELFYCTHITKTASEYGAGSAREIVSDHVSCVFFLAKLQYTN